MIKKSKKSMLSNLLISFDFVVSKDCPSKIPLQCKECQRTFVLERYKVLRTVKEKSKNRCSFCSVICRRKNQKRKTQEIECAHCHNLFEIQQYRVKRAENNFCSLSCNTKFNNSKRRLGVKRSRAEILIETLIKTDFPSLEMRNNDRNFLKGGLEIDIFLPSLKIAIELNGPVHYSPIFGEKRFKQVQESDSRKLCELNEKGFTIIIFNTAHLKYWKKAQPEIEDFYRKHIRPTIEFSKNKSD